MLDNQPVYWESGQAQNTFQRNDFCVYFPLKSVKNFTLQCKILQSLHLPVFCQVTNLLYLIDFGTINVAFNVNRFCLI